MKRRRHSSQPRLGHGVRRLPGSHSLHKELNARLINESDRYGVSRSWVVATILAEYFNIGHQLSYRKAATLRKAS